MNELIHASYEGICLVRLDRMGKGSVTSLKKYKTLHGWWFGSRKQSEKAEGDSEGSMIARGLHVTLWVGRGTVNSGGSKVEILVVTSTLTKGYNKWYMCERGKYICKKGMDKGKFRFEARMIRYDHVNWRDEYVNLVELEWGPESIFVLAGGRDIKEEKGRVIFVLE